MGDYPIELNENIIRLISDEYQWGKKSKKLEVYEKISELSKEISIINNCKEIAKELNELKYNIFPEDIDLGYYISEYFADNDTNEGYEKIRENDIKAITARVRFMKDSDEIKYKKDKLHFYGVTLMQLRMMQTKYLKYLDSKNKIDEKTQSELYKNIKNFFTLEPLSTLRNLPSGFILSTAKMSLKEIGFPKIIEPNIDETELQLFNIKAYFKLKILAIKKFELELLGYEELDTQRDRIMNISLAIEIFETWINEPLIFNDKDKHCEFYEKRNEVLAFAIAELSKVESER